MRVLTRGPQEFAHNRSFELRLKNAENNRMMMKEKEKKTPTITSTKQRKWVSRRAEPRTGITSDVVQQRPFGSDLDKVSRLAESNRLAVLQSAPVSSSPVNNNFVCSDCNTSDLMNSSMFRYTLHFSIK